MERDAYCVKCRTSRTLKLKSKAEGKEKGTYMMTTAKNGRKMLRGRCPECGTSMTKFV